MAVVEKLGGNWVIVRAGDVDASHEADAAASEDADLSPNREFWTGDRWAGQYGLAKLFTAKEEAETYFAEHRREMA